MKLYDDVVPRTCANFKALCTGEQKTDELNLHFLNSIFHRGNHHDDFLFASIVPFPSLTSVNYNCTITPYSEQTSHFSYNRLYDTGRGRY